jgi:hypothetical protein
MRSAGKSDDEHLAPDLGPVVEFYGAKGMMWGRFMKELVKTETAPIAFEPVD